MLLKLSDKITERLTHDASRFLENSHRARTPSIERSRRRVCWSSRVRTPARISWRAVWPTKPASH